jgi:hypothetical protein
MSDELLDVNNFLMILNEYKFYIQLQSLRVRVCILGSKISIDNLVAGLTLRNDLSSAEAIYSGCHIQSCKRVYSYILW